MVTRKQSLGWLAASLLVAPGRAFAEPPSDAGAESPATIVPEAPATEAADGGDSLQPESEPEVDEPEVGEADANGPPPEPELDGPPPEPELDGPPPEPELDGPPPEPDLEGPAPEPDLGTSPDYDPLRDSPEWIAARGWSRAGIVALSTGAALVIGGIAMGTSDPGAVGAGNNNFRDARDRAALLMGVPGGLLIAGGAAMLGVGQARKKRLQASFVADTSSGVLVLSGRF